MNNTYGHGYKELIGEGHVHIWLDGSKSYCADPYCSDVVFRAAVDSETGEVWEFNSDKMRWIPCGFKTEVH